LTKKIYHVLFVCTGKSARSVIAEGLMNDAGRGRFKVYSAGSHPTGVVNPFALEALAELRIPTDGFRARVGTNSAAPTHRRSISCSRCATAPPARPARSGPGSR